MDLRLPAEHPAGAVEIAIMPPRPEPTAERTAPPEAPLVSDGYEVAGTRPCSWCCTPFPVQVKPGRPRLFCRRSCRQRAYERRSGLGVLPPVDRRVMQPNPVAPLPLRRPRGYETGVTPTGERVHAMRPSGRPDSWGRWSTLCGLTARATGGPFSTMKAESCHSCAAIEAKRPNARPLAPSPTLAALRALIDDANDWVARRDRWMRGTWSGDRLPPEPATFAEVNGLRQLVHRLVEAA